MNSVMILYEKMRWLPRRNEIQEKLWFAAKKKLILRASCVLSSGKKIRFKAAANSSNSVGPRVKASEIRISLTRRVTRRFCVCVFTCVALVCVCLFVCLSSVYVGVACDRSMLLKTEISGNC